jgi:TolB-like protein
MKREKVLSILCSVLLISILLGCRGTAPTVHIREDVDFSFIKKVAVLPFENNSENRKAGEIVRQLVISELLASGLVDVVYSGDVMAAIKRQNVRDFTALTSKQIRNLGKDLKVQAVITGAVNRFGMVNIGKISAPEVTITIMMADTDTGSIIWSATVTRGGADFWARHFGTRTETLSETALAVVREAISTLYQY